MMPLTQIRIAIGFLRGTADFDPVYAATAFEFIVSVARRISLQFEQISQIGHAEMSLDVLFPARETKPRVRPHVRSSFRPRGFQIPVHDARAQGLFMRLTLKDLLLDRADSK